jgi:hypothetical protein
MCGAKEDGDGETNKRMVKDGRKETWEEIRATKKVLMRICKEKERNRE